MMTEMVVVIKCPPKMSAGQFGVSFMRYPTQHLGFSVLNCDPSCPHGQRGPPWVLGPTWPCGSRSSFWSGWTRGPRHWSRWCLFVWEITRCADHSWSLDQNHSWIKISQQLVPALSELSSSDLRLSLVKKKQHMIHYPLHFSKLFVCLDIHWFSWGSQWMWKDIILGARIICSVQNTASWFRVLPHWATLLISYWWIFDEEQLQGSFIQTLATNPCHCLWLLAKKWTWEPKVPFCHQIGSRSDLLCWC